MDLSWHVRHFMVRLGIRLLKGSGWYDGYWNHWRGAPFDEAERQGLHVLPVHFYTPVPDTRTLGDTWSAASLDGGVDLRLDEGLALVAGLAERYGAEFARIGSGADRGPQMFRLGNAAYHAGEAECLYGLVRDLQPRRIIEIGSGHSTLLTAEALRDARATTGHQCSYICIEPYPPEYLSPLPDGVEKIIASDLQSLDLDVFRTLESGDILFIDSTHVVSIGSDVIYEILRILPIIKPGVIVHIHDIFLPYEYPESWLKSERFFWNEQYMLLAFLMFNTDFEVLLATHALSRDRNEAFTHLIPSLGTARQPPSALWMRRR